jgi:hypothetical protein
LLLFLYPNEIDFGLRNHFFSVPSIAFDFFLQIQTDGDLEGKIRASSMSLNILSLKSLPGQDLPAGARYLVQCSAGMVCRGRLAGVFCMVAKIGKWQKTT